MNARSWNKGNSRNNSRMKEASFLNLSWRQALTTWRRSLKRWTASLAGTGQGTGPISRIDAASLPQGAMRSGRERRRAKRAPRPPGVGRLTAPVERQSLPDASGAPNFGEAQMGPVQDLFRTSTLLLLLPVSSSCVLRTCQIAETEYSTCEVLQCM